jgi:hypothetical protein
MESLPFESKVDSCMYMNNVLKENMPDYVIKPKIASVSVVRGL